MLIVELLAILSAGAAVGLRVALPLLLIGLFSGENLWYEVPLLSHIPPAIVLGVLVSWALFELLASKDRMGQRLVQILQLLFSPIIGSIVGITVAQAFEVEGWLLTITALISGLLALVLQLVQVGWFYRLRGLPLWSIFLQDLLCICLVLFAFDAPTQGGLIALLLLWLAIRSSAAWRKWYRDRSYSRRHLS